MPHISQWYQHWGNLAGTKWCQVIATLDQCWCCRHLSPHYHHRYLSGCPNCPNCELADRALNEISHKFSQYSAMAQVKYLLLFYAFTLDSSPTRSGSLHCVQCHEMLLTALLTDHQAPVWGTSFCLHLDQHQANICIFKSDSATISRLSTEQVCNLAGGL